MFNRSLRALLLTVQLISTALPQTAYAHIEYCADFNSISNELLKNPKLNPPDTNRVCHELASGKNDSEKELVLQNYIRLIDRLDDPNAILNKQQLAQLNERQIGAIQMALRVYLYSRLYKTAVTDEERGLFLAVTVATAGIMSFHSDYLFGKSSIEEMVDKNGSIEQKEIDLIAPLTFEPINQAQHWVLFEFMTRFLLKSRCGDGALAGIDISRIIQKTVGEKKYPHSEDKASCAEYTNRASSGEPEDFVPCEQEVLQLIYEADYNPVFSALTHIPPSVWFAAAPIERSTPSDRISFPTLDEYWDTHRPISLYSFADYNYRTPWCTYIMRSIYDYAKQDPAGAKSVANESEETASAFLAPIMNRSCRLGSKKFSLHH